MTPWVPPPYTRLREVPSTDIPNAQHQIELAVREALNKVPATASYSNDIAVAVTSGLASSLLRVLAAEIETRAQLHESSYFHELRQA